MYRLYTHNDLDGVGCGIVARLAFGENAEIRYNSVTGLDVQIERYLEKVNEKKKSGDYLFITDLSVHDENAKKLNELVLEGEKVKLIDHHKTALHLNDFPWGKVQVDYDDGRLASATSLFYEYLLQHHMIEPANSLHEFVELVRQYDTWEWEQNENSKAKQLNDLFFMVSIDEFEEKMVERIKNHNNFEFSEFEKKLLDLEEEKIGRYLRRKKREIVQTFIGEFCAGIVHAESYHSELGNELGKENPHLDYIAILNMGGKKISYRTIHDHVDVSAVADAFGGGGHAKAAGSTMTEEAYRLYVAEPFPIEPMRADAGRNIYNLKGSRHGSMYENRKRDKIFIFPQHEHKWMIEMNGKEIETSFHSFEESERFLKRNYAAWLVRDEFFVDFLLENMMRAREKQ